MTCHSRREIGSSSILVLGVLVGAVFLLTILGAVGSSYVAHAELQQAADIAARTVELGVGDESRTRAAALARANGAATVHTTLEAAGTRVHIEVERPAPDPFGVTHALTIRAEAWADVPLPAIGSDAGPNPPGVYSGPLEIVDGVQVCPAVAAAWRRMDAAASADGVTLTPTSGFRGWAEQAVLYAQLGPGLAAPPGTSRHHDATELDVNVGIAGSSIHRWLQTHAPAFGFVQRYSWEPWHWGYVAGCGGAANSNER